LFARLATAEPQAETNHKSQVSGFKLQIEFILLLDSVMAFLAIILFCFSTRKVDTEMYFAITSANCLHYFFL